jgi:hypothetical protein
MKLCTALLFVVSAYGLSVRAEGALFGATASGSPGELYILDPATGAVVQDIGPLNDNSSTNYPITGLAFSPLTGVLYGSTANNAPVPGHLVTVDPLTALVTDIGSFNLTLGTLADLAFDNAGNLYGISSKFGPQLYSVDSSTGLASQIGSTGLASTEGAGIAVSPDGVFFASPDHTRFGTYDPTTGAFTNIAAPGLPTAPGAYAALSFKGGVLYGLWSAPGSPPPTRLVTFNTTTGAITDLGSSVIALDAIAFQTALPGDYNHDGTVDTADYVVWRKSDGLKSGYDLWRANFGQTAGSGSGAITNAAVPEPTKLVLLMFAGVGWCVRRSRAA